ncbi:MULTISPECIES: flagellar basal-body rod protein FlgF [unclassified Roseivivax]|uniref:flagellar basal-body rod protein FlgF n=1 Tax=Roseivivax sp. GX 12232 TaxID=2900547 RepID=UPI001E4245B3|nr:flagellar basal-body rod protein FlgF [Roseivivax sp. GX 12232]MCE0503892.1 flagellar basal-body rod protein FlgF [Roseivivax sp. GX 12232]
MDSASYIPISLVSALQRDLDVTANNIANADTVGFKRERVAFESYLHEDTGDMEDVHFVVDGGSYLDNSQGRLQATGNPLDIALEGEGWFAFETREGGVAYGRDGRLTLDNQGTLVTIDGAQILDVGGAAINLAPEAVAGLQIAEDGTMSGPDGAALGQIGVFRIDDLQAYERAGSGLFRAPPGGGVAPELDDSSVLIQGAVEGSNVQAITEITRLMEIQKAYERAQTVSQSADDLRQDALSRLSRPA